MTTEDSNKSYEVIYAVKRIVYHRCVFSPDTPSFLPNPEQLPTSKELLEWCKKEFPIGSNQTPDHGGEVINVGGEEEVLEINELPSGNVEWIEDETEGAIGTFKDKDFSYGDGHYKIKSVSDFAAEGSKEDGYYD